jgi:DNA-binding transcriptional MerR regulator
MESIGALSRRTGIPIKTIRYYSDIGLVPESRRTRSGYRHYDGAAQVRLELVRTLRELGFDLATIRAVLDRRNGIAAIAAAQVDAIDTQIRLLRLRRAVLRRLARHEPTDQEVELVHRLAHASADERRRIMNDFIDHIFAGIEVDPEFEARFRSGVPELPEEPTDAQVDAWVELAELVADPDFRARIRRMSEAAWGGGDRPEPPAAEVTAALMGSVEELVVPALESGLDPADPAATPVVDELMARVAVASGKPDSPEFRRASATAWATGSDARAERYWQLIGVINGWPPFAPRVPAFEWLIAAVRARLPE